MFILFKVDESDVEILSMTPSVEATALSEAESYRYPRAGEKIALGFKRFAI